MNSISIAIHVVTQGDDGSTVYGEANWLSKYTIDFRENDRDYSQLFNYGQPILFLSLVKEGALFTIVKPANGGRSNDYISSWVFVPAELEISGKELKVVIERATNILSGIKTDIDEINSIVNKKYQTRESVPYYSPSDLSSSLDAVRYYGGAGYSLSEILNSPFQNSYSKYRRVFLINGETEIKFQKAEDLSNQEIVNFVTISLPSRDPNGFMPYLDNNPYIKPICVQEKTKVTITWKKKGYADISYSFNASPKSTIPMPQTKDIKLSLYLGDIRVYNKKDGSLISSFNVHLEGKNYPSNTTVLVHAQSVQQIEAVINSDGFVSKKVILADAYKKGVGLQESQYVYNIELRFPDAITTFTNKIVSRRPLDAYSIHLPQNFKLRGGKLKEGENEVNLFDYKESRNYDWHDNDSYDYQRKKQRGLDTSVKRPKHRNHIKAIVVVLALILIVVIGFFIKGVLSSNDDNIRNFPYNDSDTTLVTNDQAKLIQSLDSSKTWSKDTLESLGLHGLFDDMVNYRFSSIADVDINIVNQSIKMRELIRVATEARSKNATPSEDTYNYNKEKNTIDIDAYIKRVKKFIKKSDNSFSDDPQEINSSVDVDDEPIENSTHQTHEVSNARPKKVSSANKSANNSWKSEDSKESKKPKGGINEISQ
jgi:hypothetical protein